MIKANDRFVFFTKILLLRRDSMRMTHYFSLITMVTWIFCSSSFSQEFIIAGMGVMPKAWDKQANFTTLERYARDAANQGVKMIVTPEGFLDGYTANPKLRKDYTREKYFAMGETIDGPMMQRVVGLSRELEIYIAIGFAELRQGKMYNTLAVFDPSGKLILRYAKTHAPGEIDTTPGHEFPVAKTELGTFGAFICYDRRLPEVARILAVKGARLFIVPAYGPDSRIESETIMKIRAYENRAFVAWVNPTRVLLIDPEGNVLASKEGNDDKMVIARFDLSKAGGGNLSNRVPEIYKELSNGRCTPFHNWLLFLQIIVNSVNMPL
jgi:predicted amidohydrolase